MAPTNSDDFSECRICEKSLNSKTDPFVACDVCNSLVHGECTGLQRKMIRDSATFKKAGFKWTCKPCTVMAANEGLGLTDDEAESTPLENKLRQIERIMNELKDLFRRECNKVRSEFQHEVEGMRREVESLKDGLEKATADTKYLKEFVMNLVPSCGDSVSESNDPPPERPWSEVVSKGRTLGENLKNLGSGPHPAHQNSIVTTIELNEREKRSKNIILYGVPEEVDEPTPSKAKLVQVLDDRYRVDLREVDIMHALRLGKIVKDSPRPLKVILATRDAVDRIISGASHLIPKGKRWEVSRDQTPLQRQDYNNLKSQLCTIREQGKQAIVRNGKIVLLDQEVTANQNTTK